MFWDDKMWVSERKDEVFGFYVYILNLVLFMNELLMIVEIIN